MRLFKTTGISTPSGATLHASSKVFTTNQIRPTKTSHRHMEKRIAACKRPHIQKRADLLQLFENLSERKASKRFCDFAQAPRHSTFDKQTSLYEQSFVVLIKGFQVNCANDRHSFNRIVLQPHVDGFRNHRKKELWMKFSILPYDDQRALESRTSQSLSTNLLNGSECKNMKTYRGYLSYFNVFLISCKELQEENKGKAIEDYSVSSTTRSEDDAAESLHSRIRKTRKRVEKILNSLLLLHFLIGEKLHCWKTRITNFSADNILTPKSPVSCCATSTITSRDKHVRKVNTVHVTNKQLRRQNRATLRNNLSNSNRQRGMKNGRFQSNVGHRESWR